MNGTQTKTNPNATITSSSTSSTQASTSSSMTSMSTVVTNPPPATSSASPPHHTTSALGVGLGVGLGVAALLTGIGALIYVLRARRKRGRSQLQEQPVEQKPLEKSSHPVYEMQDPKENDIVLETSTQKRKPVAQRSISAAEME